MSYRNGEPVTVRLDSLKSTAHLIRKPERVSGRILQRCSPTAYDVLLDDPLSSEFTLLSWVPEELISPMRQARLSSETDSEAPAKKAGQ